MFNLEWICSIVNQQNLRENLHVLISAKRNRHYEKRAARHLCFKWKGEARQAFHLPKRYIHHLSWQILLQISDHKCMSCFEWNCLISFFNFFYFLNKSKWKKNCKEKHCTKNESLLWQSNVHLHTHKQITVFGINRWKRLFVSGDNNFLSLDVL